MIPKIQGLLERAASCSLANIIVSSNLDEVALQFSTDTPTPNFTLELYDVTFFKVSRTPNDEGCYNVGKVELQELDDNGFAQLRMLGYAFKSAAGGPVGRQGRAFHFHIEGDIVCDFVCRTFSALEEIV